MGFLVRLRQSDDGQRGLWTGPLTSSSPELARLWAAPPSSSGVGVNEQTALMYSAFWACVNAISTDVASLPLIHYKRDQNGGKTRYTDSKLYRLLHDEPNPEMTSITMRQTLTAHALTWGNGYAEIQRDGGGRPVYLWPLTPERVQPVRDPQTQLIVYHVIERDGSTTVLPAADMLHIPGLGWDGLVGYSVVAKARESIGLGLATERFGGTFFGNGATFGGVIAYKGPRPTEMAEKNYRESLEARHQGVDRAHKLLALYNDATYTRMGIPPDEAQFLETRTFQIEEMCRWFRMPPHKIQHLLRATNNNIEHQGIEYYTDTMRPWTVRWEQEINRKLIHGVERRIQFVEHLIDGVLRGDLKSRYDAYAVGRQWGWLCADDICDRENMNPLPNGQGQIYLVPLNMTPANRIDELISAQIAAKKTPPAPSTPGAPADGTTDPNAIQQNARELVEAIRGALTDAEQRADAHLTRAIAAENHVATGQTELQADADRARAAATLALQDAAGLRSLLLEATEREATERTAREAAEARDRRSTAKHAKATAHITMAQTALAAADAARQVSEGNLDQALAQAARAEARAASLEALCPTCNGVGLLPEHGMSDPQGQLPCPDCPAGEKMAADSTAATAKQEAQASDTARQAAEANLVVARTALTSMTAARDAVQAALETRDTPVVDDSRVGMLTAQIASLQGTVTDRETALTVAATDLAAADARGIEETLARTTAETVAAAARASERTRLTAVMGAHRGLIADAMGRMIRRETEKARRAQATPEKLRAWIETFYPVHADICRAALLPAIRAHLAWQQSTEDPAVVTQAIITAHIAESIRQLRLVLESDAEDVPMTLETTLRQWELERADAVADVLLKDALRSLAA